ncbi:hypothetical protein O3M35_009951 [Rhynocoris fuscipes]|uniref:Uncharacterized protein n=1 Tax=Rhynocoris fuscipes TaxID=488301 RepID=A0AAW1CZG3_9HEMI
MAKFDIESLKFPEFREDDVFTGEKVEEVLNKIKAYDESYDADEVRRKLAICDKGIEKFKEQIEKYDNIAKNLNKVTKSGKQQQKQKPKKEKPAYDEGEHGRTFLESKKQMSDYIEKERKVCNDLENKLKTVQEALENLDFDNEEEQQQDLNLFAESKAAISAVINDFGALEEILKARINDDTFDDDTFADYEEDLKELRSVQREAEKSCDFYLDM